MSLVSLPSEVFEICSNIAVKFSNNEICYSSKKEDFCPPQYKTNGVKTISDVFLQDFLHSYGRNSIFAIQILNNLSIIYGIADAILVN